MSIVFATGWEMVSGKVRAVLALFAFAVAFFAAFLAADPAWAQGEPEPAALEVEKTDNPDPVAEGERLTYTVTVTNTGGQPATNVTLVDNLPANTTFVSVETTNGACPTPPPNPGDPGGTVQCNLGSLEPDQSATVTIRVRPTAQAAIAGTITNTATAASPDAGTATAQQNTTVTPNLTIVKEDSPGGIEVGDLIRYTLVVRNRGEAEATNVVVRDQLPDQVEFIDSDAEQGSCDEQPEGVVECDLGNVSGGEIVRVRLLVRAEEAGDITNTAQVFAGDVEEAIDEDVENTRVEGDGGTTKESTEETTVASVTEKTNVVAGTTPNKKLPDTGGLSPLLMIGAGLSCFGIAILRRR